MKTQNQNEDKYFWIAIMHDTFGELMERRPDIQVFDLINVDQVTQQSSEEGDFVLSYPVYMTLDDCDKPMTGNLRVCFSSAGKILDDSCGDWEPAAWTPEDDIEDKA